MPNERDERKDGNGWAPFRPGLWRDPVHRKALGIALAAAIFMELCHRSSKSGDNAGLVTVSRDEICEAIRCHRKDGTDRAMFHDRFDRWFPFVCASYLDRVSGSVYRVRKAWRRGDGDSAGSPSGEIGRNPPRQAGACPGGPSAGAPSGETDAGGPSGERDLIPERTKKTSEERAQGRADPEGFWLRLPEPSRSLLSGSTGWSAFEIKHAVERFAPSLSAARQGYRTPAPGNTFGIEDDEFLVVATEAWADAVSVAQTAQANAALDRDRPSIQEPLVVAMGFMFDGSDRDGTPPRLGLYARRFLDAKRRRLALEQLEAEGGELSEPDEGYADLTPEL